MTTRKSFLDLTKHGQRKRLKKYYLSQPQNMPSSDNLKISDDVVELEGEPSNQDNYVTENTSVPHLESVLNEAQNLNYFEADTDESDIEEGLFAEPYTFLDKLRDWAEMFCISHVALTALLIILRAHGCFSSLPSDSRTLLQTPRKITVKSVEPGQYHHIGIAFWLNKIWSKCDQHIKSIELMFGIDGLPLFRSSCGELWPILGSVFNVQRLEKLVFPVGLYYGSKKPTNCGDFLSDFISEVSNLTETGISLQGKHVSIKLKGIVCDAPAKSFILCTKGHAGYSSCTKCKQEGQYFSNRITFPQVDNNNPRTHEGFLMQEDPDFHNLNTPLLNIPGINFISSFPLDYMHLVCLGVVRTILYIWLFSPPPLKLNHRLISNISANLMSLQSLPSEFCRKPRSLEYVKRWKATEFRQFLLYTGPLVLHDVLISDYEHYFENFLTLHVAMRILLSPKLCHRHLQYARGLLVHFVKTFKVIYGQKYITHNFHGLLHISDDVTTFGSLDNCSAFKYENYLYPLKKLVRKGELPLQQVSKRIIERAESVSKFYQDTSKNQNHHPFFTKPHESGPILEGCDPSTQYREVKYENFTLSISPPNSCCKLIDGSIAVVMNIIYNKRMNSMGVLCKRFLYKSDLFDQPLCPSSEVGIFKVKHLLLELEFRQFKDIEEKMVMLEKNGKNIVLSLLHSD